MNSWTLLNEHQWNILRYTILEIFDFWFTTKRVFIEQYMQCRPHRHSFPHNAYCIIVAWQMCRHKPWLHFWQRQMSCITSIHYWICWTDESASKPDRQTTWDTQEARMPHITCAMYTVCFIYGSLPMFVRVIQGSLNTVYPKKYAHGCVVLCFAVVMQSFILNSHEVFIHIHQGCFAGTGAIVRLPQCQWSKPDGYGKISQCMTITKHSKAKTVCIFLGIYCS